MREHMGLFRGKRIDNGEWVEGFFKNEKLGVYLTAAFIVELLTSGVWEVHRVDPSTAGQYTGLTDKNGKMIFEGDIVHAVDALSRPQDTAYTFVGVVDYKDCSFAVVSDSFTYYRWMDYVVEVIGNIHDNKELLEEIK